MGSQSSGGLDFTVNPATQTTQIDVDTAAYTIQLIGGVAPVGGLIFTMADRGGSGVFTPASPITIPAGQTSATFVYHNHVAGSYYLDVTQASIGTRTAQAVVTSGSPPAPTSFTVTPAQNSATPNQATPAYYITLMNGASPAVAGVGGQAFTLSSNDGGGVFAPGTVVTIPQGQSSVSFTYKSPNIGRWTLTASANGNPYAVNTGTAQAVIYQGVIMGAVVNPSDVVWGVGYLYATKNNPDDIPFGTLQDFSLKDSEGLKELMGPEGLAAVAVGISDRKMTGSASWARIRIQQWLKLRGGSSALNAAIADPVAAPTLTAASGGNLAAGTWAVYFAYRNRFGTTKVSPGGTVVVTSNQKITITSLTGLAAGITSVDVYMTNTFGADATAALALTAYFCKNFAVTAGATGAMDVGTSGVPAPAVTAPVVPASSNIGSAKTVYTALDTDEPTAFKMHFKTPSDGSQAEMLVYGCLAPDLEADIKLRDFVIPKFNVNIYGDATIITGRTAYYELLLPGDQTVSG